MEQRGRNINFRPVLGSDGYMSPANMSGGPDNQNTFDK